MKLFLDASFLYALYDQSDSLYKKAHNLLSELDQTNYFGYLSTNIIMETATLLSQRVSKSIANHFLDEIRSGQYIVINPTDGLITKAENLFRSIKSKNVSYSDCISFEVCKEEGINVAFAFDRHFKDQGIRRFGIDR